MPRIRRRLVNGWIRSVAGGFGKEVGEIAYIFCSEKKMLALNRQYLRHDYYTDVLTFDYSAGQVIAGDIFIGLETVQTNAALFRAAYAEELHRTMIHGVLHLCGLGDKTLEEQRRMRANEARALAVLPKEA